MKRAQRQPITEGITIFAGIYCKAYSVPDEGTLLPQHSHQSGHVTAVTSGAVRVWRDGTQLGDFHAPALISIPARVMHAFLTLTPGVCLMCIHNADRADADGEPPVLAEHHLELED